MESRDRWPLGRRGEPLRPRAQPGYYPGFETLRQQAYWDEATRRVILDRVHHVPSIRFFSADAARLLTAICDRLLPQDDRDAEHRVPIAPWIDHRLFEGRSAGYRYEDMPPDPDAYRLGLAGIDAGAQAAYGVPFVELDVARQDAVLKSIHDGKPIGGEEIWQRMPPHHYWLLLLSDVVATYYAHPYAWDEIGFGGPAYPRGYMRLENGLPEPWESAERRYEWRAPPASRAAP